MHFVQSYNVRTILETIWTSLNNRVCKNMKIKFHIVLCWYVYLIKSIKLDQSFMVPTILTTHVILFHITMKEDSAIKNCALNKAMKIKDKRTSEQYLKNWSTNLLVLKNRANNNLHTSFVWKKKNFSTHIYCKSNFADSKKLLILRFPRKYSVRFFFAIGRLQQKCVYLVEFFSLYFRIVLSIFTSCIFPYFFLYISVMYFFSLFPWCIFPYFLSPYFRPTFSNLLTKVLLSYQLRHLIRCTIGFI